MSILEGKCDYLMHHSCMQRSITLIDIIRHIKAFSSICSLIVGHLRFAELIYTTVLYYRSGRPIKFIYYYAPTSIGRGHVGRCLSVRLSVRVTCAST